MKSELDVVKTLVLKADNDLKMARIGFDHDAPLDTVAFHVQQSPVGQNRGSMMIF